VCFPLKNHIVAAHSVKAKCNDLGSWSVFVQLIFSKTHLKKHQHNKRAQKRALVTQVLDAPDKHQGREDDCYYRCS
jgi:hypothetical protein